MCLKSTYFSYGRNFYEQIEGAAMGSMVSSVVTNVYIELFERYIDDTFCILRKGSTQELLHHLNEVRLTIKITVEQKENGTLPFLNMLLRRTEDGSLDVSVYRKLMHMDRHLYFKSHHLTHMKRDVVRCLNDRARRIINMQDNLANHLDRILKQNSCPANFVHNASTPPTHAETAGMSSHDEEQEEGRGPLVVIVYVAGMTKNIRRVARSSKSE